MPPVQRPLLALVLRLLAGVVLATLAMLIKYTTESGVAFIEVLFWRQFPTIPFLLGWLALRGEIGRLRTERLGTHARRAVLGSTGMLLNFGALLFIPLAEATTLSFTTPIFAVILAALMLHERVGPYRWFAVVLGFAGILIIAQPGQTHVAPLGALMALAGGFTVAVISIQVRDLARTDESLSIVFWFAAIASPALALFMPFYYAPHSLFQWGLLAATGLCGCVGQLLLTASLRYGQVASVTVMDYSMLGWATLYGWLIWDHLPPTATWLGAPLIIAAGIVIAWREHRLHQRVPPASASGVD